MKAGDTVVCINNCDFVGTYLTLNKQYKIIQAFKGAIKICDDINAHYWYDPDMFIKLTDLRKQKIIKIYGNR